MTSSTSVWISEHAHQRLKDELRELRTLLERNAAVTVDDAGDGENLKAIQRARQARVQHIHDLLVHAVVGEDPPDDGVAEPGMVLTVRYEDTENTGNAGDTETFLMGVLGTEFGDLDIYSVQSPLGRALLGARVGQQRTYRAPTGAAVTVTLLGAVPYGLHHRQPAT